MANNTITEIEPTASFVYEPLNYEDSIRLLLLEPPTLEDPGMVRGRLEHTTLTHYEHEIIEPYTALSYVWGDASMRKTVFIKDIPVQVTSNLYDALRDIRDERRVLRLWADALCINQSDNDEKGLQIGLMGRIYSLAGSTVIYLGAPHSNEAASATGTISYDDVDESKCNMLFRSPWFRRAWVYQEAVLSRDPRIQFGRWRCTWGQLANFATHTKLFTKFFFLQIHRARADHIYSKLSWSRQYDLNGVVHAVSSRRGLGASNPRDLIFAYLGLGTISERVQLNVDYTSPWEQVYQDFAQLQLQKRQTYDLFACLGGDNLTSPKNYLQSWVRNFYRFFLPPLPSKHFISSSQYILAIEYYS
jgi:hypothetical protein